eukprot:TRINITY_DN44703_c0_g1_i1.p1 TRINITY_DN44703_c0_g1~~TRINITY_DN44703_c0_g1_i1.p1  ORF type:complete len:385 (-),score=84.21 TRINITY_DN44703_c0_g1_i1:53-1177(-)
MAPPKKKRRQEEAVEAAESDDSSELELTLDADGRVAWEGGRGIDFNFREFTGLVEVGNSQELSALRESCARAFTARSKSKEEYSSGETYWVPADATPTSRLERLALKIFRLHTCNATFDATRSGAEWWTLVVNAEDDVGWHWDKDYGLEADESLSVHPHVSTVTYLCEVGGPTVVLDRRCGMRGDTVVGPIGLAHLSYPKVGKHIVFDGQLLHAAPSELAMKQQDTQKKRITFLVNVWVNHRPIQTSPYKRPADLDKSPLAEENLGKADAASSVVPVLELKGGTCNGEEKQFSWKLKVEAADGEDEEAEEEEAVKSEAEGEGGCGKGKNEDKDGKSAVHKVCVSLPLRRIQEALDGRSHSSFTVGMQAGSAAVK